MAERVGWETRYYLSYQTGSISANDGSATGVYLTTDNGIGGINPSGKCGLLLDNTPTIDPGVEHINTPKALGIAQERTGVGYEFITGKKMPVVSLEMGMNEYRMAILGWLLFQKGVTEGGASLYTKTMIPPVAGASDCEVWCDVSAGIGAPTAAFGHSMTGAIASQIVIAGEEGGRMTLNADLMGRGLVLNYNHTASDWSNEGVADHMFFDYAFQLLGTTDVSIKSFDVTIANNAVASLYDAQTPAKYILGKFAVSGNMKISMADATIGDNAQITNFIDGTDVLLTATYTAKNIITINMKYNGAPDIDPAEELLLSLPFVGVYDGTNNAIKIEASDSIQRTIP